jgi:hypothetical protein
MSFFSDERRGTVPSSESNDGRGVTTVLQRELVNGIVYMDTPGLSDPDRRKSAAAEIERALQTDGEYRAAESRLQQLAAQVYQQHHYRRVGFLTGNALARILANGRFKVVPQSRQSPLLRFTRRPR